jgi:hypothetical protein
MAFVQRLEKFIRKGTQSGVQLVKIIHRITNEISGDIKIQCGKIGAGFTDEIGITHRIGYYKFIGMACDGDFNCFVSSNLGTENST